VPTRVAYLYPEECPGPFYMGWWLYLRDRADGSRNDDGDWGWLRYDGDLRLVREFLLSVGRADPPPVTYTASSAHQAQKWGEWFAANYPGGIKVLVHEDDNGRTVRYEMA
jgi:hypothetical protein